MPANVNMELTEFQLANEASNNFVAPRVRVGTQVYIYKTKDLPRAIDGRPGILGMVESVQTDKAVKVYIPSMATVVDNVRHKTDPIGKHLPTEWGFWEYSDETKMLLDCARKLGIIKPEPPKQGAKDAA